MKKILSFLLTIVMLLSISTPGFAAENTQKPDDTQNPSPISANGKVLVVYFSAQGHTERVAQVIADTLDADIFELEPVEPYTSDDLNYGNPNSRVCREHNDPSLQNISLTETTPANWDNYDTVFVGYPIWWHAAAWPVNGFVTGNDFTGKTVIPFCTSASSGLENSDILLKNMVSGGNWLSGRNFFGRDSENTVRDWALSLNLNKPDPGPDPELHGKISVSAKYSPSGEIIQITTYPDSGYKTGRVTVTEDISGNQVLVTGDGNSYSFQMPNADVTIHVDFIRNNR